MGWHKQKDAPYTSKCKAIPDTARRMTTEDEVRRKEKEALSLLVLT